MSKYGKVRYGKGKYGRYEITIITDQPLSQITRYRLKAIDRLKRVSRPVVNTSVIFPASGPVKIRLRTNDGQFVTHDTQSINGETIKIRVKSVSNNTDSQWTESVIGTIKQ